MPSSWPMSKSEQMCVWLRAETARASRRARSEVLVHLQQACELSDFKACAFAAHMTFQGSGVPKDLPAAIRLATKACDGGELSGCTTLALVDVQKEAPTELNQARGLLTKACDGGEANACRLIKSLPK